MDWFWKTGCKTVTENDRLNLNLRIIRIPDDLYEFCLWSRHSRPYREISAATTFPFSGLDPLGRNGMAAAIRGSIGIR